MQIYLYRVDKRKTKQLKEYLQGPQLAEQYQPQDQTIVKSRTTGSQDQTVNNASFLLTCRRTDESNETAHTVYTLRTL